MIKIIKIMVTRVEGISMSLIQVQQLSRHPTDYGAEILVQVMMMKMISFDDDMFDGTGWPLAMSLQRAVGQGYSLSTRLTLLENFPGSS